MADRILLSVDRSKVFDALASMDGDTSSLGTRLVQIMLTPPNSIDRVGLLGVYGIEVEDAPDADDRHREKVIAALSIELEKSPAFVGTFGNSGVLATRLYDVEVKTRAVAKYTDRFTAYMVEHAGKTFDDGSSIEGYAHETAPRYMEDYPDESPEESAQADMDCWEQGEEEE